MGRRKMEMSNQTIKVRLPQQLIDDIELVMEQDYYPGNRQDFIGHLLARGLSSYLDIRNYILDGVEEGKLRRSVLLGAALDDLQAGRSGKAGQAGADTGTDTGTGTDTETT